MSFFDTADLPRASFLRDSSRRYRGLGYNCDYSPQTPISRPSQPRRDSAVATSLRFARSAVTNAPITNDSMAVTLEPFTEADIPSAIRVHAKAMANDPVERATSELLSDSEKNESRTHEWTLALQNPFAKMIKATDGDLIGAAGFLTHEVGGLQWTTASRKEGAGSIEKEIDDRLSQAREEVLNGDYDLWHIYLAFIAPCHQHTSAWNDMIPWGLSQADEAGKRVYVQASPTEKATYEKSGFEVKKVVKLPVDVKERESGSGCLRYLMLRPAKV